MDCKKLLLPLLLLLVISVLSIPRGEGLRFWNVVHTCCCCFVLGAFRKCPCRLNVEIVTPPSQNTQNLPLPLARTQDKEVFPSNIAEQTREAHKKPYVSSSSSVAFYEMQDQDNLSDISKSPFLSLKGGDHYSRVKRLKDLSIFSPPKKGNHSSPFGPFVTTTRDVGSRRNKPTQKTRAFLICEK